MTRRAVLPIFIAALSTVAVLAASFGLVTALPQPTKDDRIAVRLLRYLEHTHGRGSRIWIDGRTLASRCTALSPRRKLITLSDGGRFVLRGSRIRVWYPGESSLATARPESGLTRAALADLAGSYALYAVELSRPLANGDDVIAADATGGTQTYQFILARRPQVELIVDRTSLRPLAARFRSATASGHATLLPPAENAGRGSC